MVLFDPPVASWSFLQGHTSDELWRELHQATSALLMTCAKDALFDDALQAKVRTRILSVLLYWAAKDWVRIPG